MDGQPSTVSLSFELNVLDIRDIVNVMDNVQNVKDMNLGPYALIAVE